MKTLKPEIVKALKNEEKVTLGFSTGKDSLACAVLLRNAHIQYIPFYFYMAPELEFVEKSVKMFEKLLGVNVIQMPHPMLYGYLRHQDFQPPKMVQFLADLELPKFEFEDLIYMYLHSIGDETKYYDTIGMRASESFNRRKFFENHPIVDETLKKIYPIHDWNKADILQFLGENKIPLSDDYKIWNRSYDGMKYQFLYGVKKNYPRDWATLLEYFPLLEAELFRYEQNQKYF